MKKIFTLLLALVATTTLWAHGFEVNGFFYTFLEGNNVEVTYKGSYNNNEYLSAVTIPETVTYNGTTYSVTSIGYEAFKDCSSLTSVTIPNSVTSIGYEAFEGCSALTSVTIPNSVTSIGYKAFYDCESLTSVTIPNSVTSIGNEAFGECKSLTSVTIPNSVTSIGDCAFNGCSALGSPIYNIHCFAFMPTSYSGAYTIPNSIKQIAGGAFSGCQSLTSVTIPNSITSIGNRTFEYCFSLTSVTIPNSVTSIGECAFQCCTSLTSVTIPNSVTSIGWGAFRGTPLYTYRENGALYIDDCLIKVDEGFASHFRIKENTRVISVDAFWGCSSLTSVTIPNSVTRIGSSAFSDCSSLKSVTIPNSVTSIGECAFSGCKSLTSVTIPNSVTSIGYAAFDGCESLTFVTILNGVTSIGDRAFYGCESLTSVTIPNSVTSIGRGAFWETALCNDPANWEKGALYINNCLIDVHEGLIKKDEGFAGHFRIKENTRVLSDGAFSDCSSLTSVTIPNSVTSIGNGAFRDCSSLTSITIPNSVTSIGYGAFADCVSLTSITIPNSVTSIGRGALWGCKSLASVTIPNSVTSIGNEAFKYCSSLASVTIPNSVTSIGNEAFSDCSSLTSITIPSSVTSIGDAVFTSNLKSVVITAESIEEYCQSTINELLYSKGIDLPRKLVIAGQELTELVIPCTVNTITEHTFKGLDFKSISISANTIEEYFSSSINQLLYDKGIQLPRKLMIAGKKANELIIPCTLTHIADHTFKGLDYNSITISANSVEEYFSSSINQLLYDKGIQLPRKLMIAGKKANELIIPCTLTHIADHTFKGLDYNSITISANSVEEYCNSSINQLIYHKGVQLPRKLMIAGKEVTELVISEGVTEIKEEAFRGMQNIAVVTIPTSVNHIAKNAFVGTALYDNKANWVEGALYIGDCLIYVNTPLEKYDITEGTRLIADAAFEVCEGLTAVKLPRKSLLYIGTNAFSNCSLIKSVKLPKTVISVGENAFSEDTSVK